MADATEHAPVPIGEPELIAAIGVAGRLVGRVLDQPQMASRARADALSMAWYTLASIYVRATGTPLVWAQDGAPMGLAEKARDLRNELGWNQRVLAERADITQATISRIENGIVTQPTMRHLYRLAQALGTTMEYLSVDEEVTE